MDEALPVFSNDQIVGTFSRKLVENQYRYDFRYNDSAKDNQAVSLIFPIERKDGEILPIQANSFPLVFQSSLPEGWVAQKLMEQFGKGMRVNDPFAQLRLIGRNPVGRNTFGGPRCAGDVESRLLDMAQKSEKTDWFQQVITKLSPEAFGLSGAMPKFQAPQDNVRPATLILPQTIVKVETPDYFGVCIAEDYALQTSRNLNLDTADAHLNDRGDALLIKRFDIEADRYLGFDDACVLNGFPSLHKYDGCIEKLFWMVEDYTKEDQITDDKTNLLSLVFLNDALRNGDAHLKNFGMLYESGMDARLSPVYDILDTTLFNPSDFPALTIHQHFPDEAGRYKKWFDRNDLENILDTADLPGVSARQVYQQVLGAIEKTNIEYRSWITTSTMDKPHKEWAMSMLDRMDRRILDLSELTGTGKAAH
jgi:serine/threonine-protein kinase HipA